MLGSAADIDFMLQDAGVPVIIGNVSAFGIFDESSGLVGMPSLDVATRETTLLVRTGKFPALKNGVAATVDGKGYTVRKFEPEDDGQLTRLTIARTST